ncbi:carboxylesterase [Xylogone sp. PMI_703]|nr:carboxylesterase [Xylogone sp. PMI_703]
MINNDIQIIAGENNFPIAAGADQKGNNTGVKVEEVPLSPLSPIGIPINGSGKAEISRSEQSIMEIQINNLKISGFKSIATPTEAIASNGLSSTTVANFLNIPYARIPARFRQSVPIDPRKESGIIDATKYGPRCPQPVDVLHDATKHLYPRMGTLDRQSEFECLSLNIYAPVDAIEGKKKLPVLVWIHGGAFTYGDGGCESDGNYLVHRSVALGKPIIVVSMSYRLGYFGFLSSKELLDEAQSFGEAGFRNQGLYDQRLGLQWVQQNIHFFGGNGWQVTAAGESAGAYSIFAHLRSNFPAFQQAFMLSCPSVALLTPQQSQETFDRLIAEGTNLSPSAPAGDKLAALRSLSTKDLERLLEGHPARVALDEEFFLDLPNTEDDLLDDTERPFPSWVKLVVVGMTQVENALFSSQWYDYTKEQILQAIGSAILDPSYKKEVFEAYSISDSSSHEELVAALANYTSDCLFAQTTYSVANTISPYHGPQTFLYSFDQVDITSKYSAFKNQAYHSLDNAFLFHLPPVASESAPEEFQATSNAYSKACIDLVNGEQPWEAYGVGRRCMSFDGKNTRLVSEKERDCGFKRWGRLTSTPERKEMFGKGRQLLFEAMKYAMSLDYSK